MKSSDIMSLGQWATVVTLVISAVFMVVGAVIGQPALTLVFVVFAICALVAMPAQRRRRPEPPAEERPRG